MRMNGPVDTTSEVRPQHLWARTLARSLAWQKGRMAGAKPIKSSEPFTVVKRMWAALGATVPTRSAGQNRKLEGEVRPNPLCLRMLANALPCPGRYVCDLMA